MAYDRYDPRERTRYGRPRSSDDFDYPRSRSSHEDRGFFERAGDEIASWFGDEDAERRRDRDYGRDERFERGDRFERGSQAPRYFGSRERSDFDRDSSRGFVSASRDRDYPLSDRGGYRPFGDDSFLASNRQPMTGRFESRDRSSRGERDFDPHYRSWRQSQISQLDNDYDEYRRENQSRFDRDFGSWRDQRMQKRGLLGQIREHMEVVGNDDEHVGTVDRVAGDRIILTKSDPESGGTHHSLTCGNIDRVEDNRVVLDCSAQKAKTEWRDESRSRALFEREDQGEVGPHVLNRSFEGTYR